MLCLWPGPGTSVPHELPDTKYIKAGVVWENAVVFEVTPLAWPGNQRSPRALPDTKYIKAGLVWENVVAFHVTPERGADPVSATAARSGMGVGLVRIYRID
jgi:hypothetical protein